MRARLKVFFDGGCRPNPGTIEIAVVAAGRTTILRDVGYGTSSDAEWNALIHALTIAQSLGAPDAVLIGDAIDVINKARGRIPCRGTEADHLARFRTVARGDLPRLRHVARTQNLAGIALATLHPR